MDFQQEVSDLLRVGSATFEVVMELLSVIRMFSFNLFSTHLGCATNLALAHTLW